MPDDVITNKTVSVIKNIFNGVSMHCKYFIIYVCGSIGFVRLTVKIIKVPLQTQ